MSFEKEFILNVQASAPIIQIISHETLRIRGLCAKAAKTTKRNFYCWDRINGLRQRDGDRWKTEDEIQQPHEVLEWLIEEGEKKSTQLLLLLEDFHPNLEPMEYTLIARLRNFAIGVAQQSITNTTVVLSQPCHALPSELEKETQVMEMPLPDVHVLEKIAEQIKIRYKLDERDYHPSKTLLEAALGLSTSEAQLAFARAACQHKRITEREIPFILKEKEQVIRKSGHLEYFHPKSTLADVGGVDNLKQWLQRRREAFSDMARDFGLETPRGVLLLGLPGTGKSLAAKAVANVWQLPLLRLDMGKIYGGIVGQSEGNMRSALKTAEALSPCILWIDEIEKGLSGIQSSGSTDGGTTARVLGSFLTWMQEKEKPVFVVATANNISQLPPELLRKGRVDEIFFVDLPVQADREEILRIHLKRRKAFDGFTERDIHELANASQGFTGAELEESVKEAMFLAFDKAQLVSKQDVMQAIENTSPLSWTMHENIKQIRTWAKGRAVPASSAPPETLSKPDTATPRLKQEENFFFED